MPFIRKSLTILALSLLAVGSVIPASATLILTPSSQTISLGGLASVDIDISGLGNGVSPALSAYTGLLISYDSTILDPAGVTFSNRLGDPADPAQVLLASDLFLPSQIQLDGISFLSAAELFAAQSNPTGQFTIASVSFTGIAAGISPVAVTYGSLSDENGNPITPNSIDGSITVSGGLSSVPEPGTLALLSAGLLGLVALRRKGRA